jgi:hypothetical protein
LLKIIAILVTCAKPKKYVNRSLRAPLQPIKVKSPWSLIGIDVTGPLKATTNGNHYVIVAVDNFT